MFARLYDRIKLRPLELSDADILYEWENDIEVWNTNGIYNPISKDHIKDFLLNSSSYLKDNNDITFAVESITDEDLIGYVQILDYDSINRRAFVGIFIQKEFRSSGYGTEALTCIVDYAFRRWNIRMLVAKILSNNEISKRLFEKCGFKYTASIPEWSWVDGDFVALNYYTLCNLLKPEYQNLEIS